MRSTLRLLTLATALGSISSQALTRNLEWLDRGLVAINTSGSNVFLSWRLLGTELKTASFNVYRDGAKIATIPATAATNYTDKAGSATAKYSVRAVVNGVEQAADTVMTPWKKTWLSIPLTPPAGGIYDTTAYTYSPGDASVGDVDGDGQYEIILKWDPSNAKDNSQSGYTGNVYLDAYKLSGKRLWRVDLGPNIRAGAHYTQFQVMDYDGDGKAEMIVKTAPGTKDASGAYLSTGSAAGADNTKDYRNSNGYILTGPEWITLFDGATGKELNTTDYLPGRGTVSAWGDNYGNRVDRFVAYTGWLDGVHPTALFERGYYTRLTLTAWDVVNKKLVKRWAYDRPAQAGQDGQGNHNGAIGDVDGDGKDEIFTGSTGINNDGTLRWDNKLGHGDAMHLGAMDPDLTGLQIWSVKEGAVGGVNSSVLVDASTGKPIWGYDADSDVGRGMAADIDATSPGYEMWSSATPGVYSVKGKLLSASKPSVNFRMYWDGDLQDELLDGTKLDKWNGNGTTRLMSFYSFPANNGVASNNSTKATPCLSADILGDWREEVIFRTANNDSLVIFTTTTPTTYRMHTLMHDPVYRASIAWQNSTYNQPPHLGFLLSDTAKWKAPDIKLIGQPSVTVGVSGQLSHIDGVTRSMAVQVMGQPSIPMPIGLDPRANTLQLRDLRGRIVAEVSNQEGHIALPSSLTHGVYLLQTP